MLLFFISNQGLTKSRMQRITIYDFLLLPIYLALFYILVKRRSMRFDDPELRKIFLAAFGFRMLGSVMYSLILQYYYGYGDSFTYYEGGTFLINQVLDNVANIKYLFYPASELQRIYSGIEGSVGGVNGYIASDSSAAVMKVSAVVSIASFNTFMITSLFFGLFSFAGQWKLFQVFNDITGKKHQKLLGFAVLYTPAIWFWGSGLLKEAICLGGVGFILSTLYNSIIKKRINRWDWVLSLFLIYMVYMIKSYIIVILAVSLFFTSLFVVFQRIRIVLLRLILVALMLIILFFSLSLSNFSEQINDLTEESVTQIETFQKSYEAANNYDDRSQAGIEVANINYTFTGILAKSPSIIFSCLFRPFIWESKKIIILFSSFESTLLLLSTLFLLYKTRFFGIFRIIFTQPFIFFSFLVSLFFATIIGFTTFNFGTMIRYKMMLLPFYYFMLVNIYLVVTSRKKNDTPDAIQAS